MTCRSTTRMIALPDSDAREGRVRWAPVRSLWMIGMTGSALLLAPLFVTSGAVLLWLLTSALTLCLGHSIGLHRLLIHRSFAAPLWFERVLVYLGSGLVDHSQKMTVAAKVMAEKKAVGQRS